MQQSSWCCRFPWQLLRSWCEASQGCTTRPPGAEGRRIPWQAARRTQPADADAGWAELSRPYGGPTSGRRNRRIIRLLERRAGARLTRRTFSCQGPNLRVLTSRLNFNRLLKLSNSRTLNSSTTCPNATQRPTWRISTFCAVPHRAPRVPWRLIAPLLGVPQTVFGPCA